MPGYDILEILGGGFVDGKYSHGSCFLIFEMHLGNNKKMLLLRDSREEAEFAVQELIRNRDQTSGRSLAT
jgi:hypothetical protein